MYMPYLLMGSCFYDIHVQSVQYAVVVQLLDEAEYAALTIMAHTEWRGNPTYAQIQGVGIKHCNSVPIHQHRVARGPAVFPQQSV